MAADIILAVPAAGTNAETPNQSAPPVPGVEPSPPGDVQAPPELPPKAEAKEDGPKESLSALAKKEAKTRKEREAFEAERKTFQAEREAFVKQQEAIKASGNDPLALIYAANPDMTKEQRLELAREIYIEALGDEAPEDLKKQSKRKEKTVEEQVQEALRKKEAEAEQARTAELTTLKKQFFSKVVTEVSATLDQYPFLKALAEKDPDYATNLLIEHADEGMLAGDARFLKTDHIAASLQEKLKQQVSIFSHLLQPQAPPADQAKETALPKKGISPTLTNTNTSAQESKATLTKEERHAQQVALAKEIFSRKK